MIFTATARHPDKRGLCRNELFPGFHLISYCITKLQDRLKPLRVSPEKEGFDFVYSTICHPQAGRLGSPVYDLEVSCATLSDYWVFLLTSAIEVVREKVQDGLTGEVKEMQYTQCKIVGNGSFGVVFQTKLSPSGEDAAIKRVLQDKRFKVGQRHCHDTCTMS